MRRWRFPARPEEPPDWPRRTAAAGPPAPVEEPPELFEPLARELASASRGEASLAGLSVRHGRVEERIWNGAGLDVAQAQTLMDGLATAAARRGPRAHASRLPFRWAGEPEIAALARRLADAATLPLSDRPAPFSTGQWLLDPGVAAAFLAALAPAFRARRPHRALATRPASTTLLRIVDDASSDAPSDGEGVATRRIVLFEHGEWAGRLEDLRSAKRSGRPPTGHGVRSSFRTPPRAAPRRLFFEADSPSTTSALLARVKRGLFAAALTAPVRVDLDADRYEIEFTGISVVNGRAQGEVGGARAAGSRHGAAAAHRRRGGGPAVLRAAVPGGIADPARRTRQLRLVVSYQHQLVSCQLASHQPDGDRHIWLKAESCELKAFYDGSSSTGGSGIDSGGVSGSGGGGGGAASTGGGAGGTVAPGGAATSGVPPRGTGRGWVVWDERGVGRRAGMPAGRGRRA